MSGTVLEVANLRKRFVDPDGTPADVVDIKCFMSRTARTLLSMGRVA
jgi:hypothetical protein